MHDSPFFMEAYAHAIAEERFRRAAGWHQGRPGIAVPAIGFIAHQIRVVSGTIERWASRVNAQ